MRMMFVASAMLACAACQPKADAPAAGAADTAAAADAVTKLEASQIAGITARNAAAASGTYAADAIFIGDNGALVTGKAAIDQMFASLVKDPNLAIDYRPGTKIVSADGTMAYAVAPYTETYTDTATNKPITIKGINLSVWRKQADGSWKLVADSNPGSIVN